MAKLIYFDVVGDNRGNLISLEGLKNIPFEIKRVYYIYGVSDKEPRGFHAHKELKQVAFCISGSCEMLLDDGERRESVLLNNPNIGVFIGSMTWREMHNFSKDCVLVVLASEYYNEDDYIRDYDIYKKMVER